MDLFTGDGYDLEAAAEHSEAAVRLRYAKKRAQEVTDGVIKPHAQPLLDFLVMLGLDNMAARRMINVKFTLGVA